jgi:hypothetical protein
LGICFCLRVGSGSAVRVLFLNNKLPEELGMWLSDIALKVLHSILRKTKQKNK